MFHFQKNDYESWAEFKCPVCRIVMDLELNEVPPEGELFECPSCAAQLTAQYQKGEAT